MAISNRSSVADLAIAALGARDDLAQRRMDIPEREIVLAVAHNLVRARYCGETPSPASLAVADLYLESAVSLVEAMEDLIDESFFDIKGAEIGAGLLLAIAVLRVA